MLQILIFFLLIQRTYSNDLIQWKVGPPVAAPGEFGHMEVPQLVEISGRYYLIFCVGSGAYAESRLNRSGIERVTETHYMVGNHQLGPYEFLSDKFLLGDAAGSHYAGKIICDPNRNWVLMTSRSWTGDGDFIGEIADPLPLHIAPDGQLFIDFANHQTNTTA